MIAASGEYINEIKQKSFELVKLPKSRRALNDKWVFKIKLKQNNII